MTTDILQLILIKPLMNCYGKEIHYPASWETKIISCLVKWIRILEHFNEQNILLGLANITKVIFAVPGTSAPAEHMFS